MYSPKLTAVSFAKFTISLLGFEHSPRWEKFESENFKKDKFLLSHFIITCLAREVDKIVISEIYF